MTNHFSESRTTTDQYFRTDSHIVDLLANLFFCTVDEVFSLRRQMLKSPTRVINIVDMVEHNSRWPVVGDCLLNYAGIEGCDSAKFLGHGGKFLQRARGARVP